MERGELIYEEKLRKEHNQFEEELSEMKLQLDCLNSESLLISAFKFYMKLKKNL